MPRIEGMGRRKMKSGDEYDALTKWRRYYAYLTRAGVVSSIKRKVRRRERREGKRDVENQ